jgi:two-component system sensor histidine kinase BaeS
LGLRLLAAFALVAVGSVGLVVAAALVGTGRGIDQAAETERARVAVGVAAAVAEAYRTAGGWEGADLAAAEELASAAGARVVVLAADGTVVAGTSAGQVSGAGATPSLDGTAGAGPLTVPILFPRANGSPSRAAAPDPTTGGADRPSGTAVDRSPSATPRPSGSGTSRPTDSGTGRPTDSGTGRPTDSGTGRPTGSGGATSPPGSPTSSPEVTSDGVPVVVDGVQVGVVGLVFATDAATAAREVAWRWIGVAAGVAVLLALLVGLLVTRRLARPLLAVSAAAQAFAAGDRTARTGVSGPGEIGTVARSVDEMAEVVTRSESSQRRLASNVAHELRTPLAALQVGLEELRDGLVEPDAGLLTGLHDQSLRLSRIVDDLTALSSAESTAFSLRWAELDLAGLARSETAAQEPRLRAAGLTVTVDATEPVPVVGDTDRLRQVLANLLSNCARYCRAGDEVSVTVHRGETAAHLVVRDTGPGIPAAELVHVFDRSWRGSTSGAAPGLGLGLAVVRELVAAHHGTVRADSDGASGTTVTVDLPLGRPHG